MSRTPTPWTFTGRSIIAGETEHVLRRDGVGWSHDDASLIAAAPELYEALKAAKEHLEYCCYGDQWEREISRDLPAQIEAALAKADGGK